MKINPAYPLFLGLGLIALVCVACPSKTKSNQDGSSTSQPASRLGMKVNSSGLTLVPEKTSFPRGQSIKVLMKNVSQKPYVFQFKGGTNGCVLPIYRMTLVDQDGRRFAATNTGSRRRCTMAIVPPRTITIPPGDSMTLQINTGRVWYLQPKSITKQPKRRALPYGTYKLQVRGGGLSLSFKGLIIEKKK